MGIEISSRDVELVCRYLHACADIIHNEIRSALMYLGEMCIIKIRDRSGEDSWFDQTGNLRSSIGYGVFEHGNKVIESAFSQVLNGGEGGDKGRQMISDLSKLYVDSYALVVIAAMEYADKVEALDNKDVLASTNLWALEKVDSILMQAKQKAYKKIDSLKI